MDYAIDLLVDEKIRLRDTLTENDDEYTQLAIEDIDRALNTLRGE